MSGHKITLRRIVRHKNQEVTEFWQHCSHYGWVPVEKSVADEWQRGTWEYYELIHTMDRRKDGKYGPYIIG